MMELCDEDAAKFMSESLLDHAKHICRYARAYSQPIYQDEKAEEALKEKFYKNVERMTKEMYALMQMARHKGISRYCNKEQIEAYMDEVRMIVNQPAFVPQASPLMN